MSVSTIVSWNCLVLVLHCNFVIVVTRDIHMHTPDVIRYYGYQFQNHSVTTEDGYILNIHRMPSGRNFSRCFQKVPVLLLHGVFCSSYSWVGNTDKTSLGFLLADAGYDVWMGNFRGTSYSYKHVNLSYSEQKYWDFCFDQHGTMDIPSMIDHILNLTNQRSLLLICHSMGCLSSVIMLSTKQEYKFKVRGLVAIAPGWNFHFLRSKVAQFTVKLFPFLKTIFNYYNIWSFPPVAAGDVGLFVCKDHPFLCFAFYNLVDGSNFFGYNFSRLNDLFSNFPDITSIKTFQHYGQWFIKNENETMFDFEDYKKNTIHYKQMSPLKYNYSSADVPIAVLSAPNDLLVDRRGIIRGMTLLPRVKFFYQVPDDNFNHLSFLFGVNAKELVYDKIMEMLTAFSRRCFH